jgi:hypothetical protein
MRGVLLALSYTLPYRGSGICSGWDALGRDAEYDLAIHQTASLRYKGACRAVPATWSDLFP